MSLPAFGGESRPSGTLTLLKLPSQWPNTLRLRDVAKHGLPRPGLAPGVAAWRLRNLPNLARGLRKVFWAKLHRLPVHYGALYLDVLHADGSRTPLGLASMRVVTTAGVNFIRDAFLNTTELENMKFHAFGTGTNAEAVGDTLLQTEETTQYAPDSTRPTGSQVSQGAGIYRTVGTYSPDSGGTRAITEHGIFSSATGGAVTLLDRSVFSAVNLVAGSDSLQATYDFTCTAGS